MHNHRRHARSHPQRKLTVSYFLLSFFLFFLIPAQAWAFDWDFEGRVKAGSSYIFDSPPFHKDFDSEAELRLGVLGNAWSNETYSLDYELSADGKLADGPSVQSGLRRSTDVDFFRAWLRFGTDRAKVRGGRQKILFGSGAIFRPLGFFDTRDVTGVVPETRGVDGVRADYFFDDTTSIQGWAVPGKQGENVIAGARWEGLIADIETGFVAQYHPSTDLDDLADFDKELVQLGYHFKGEKNIAYWNESRFDVELKQGSDAVRFATVLGADYTFDIGDGLHALLEYFFTTQEKNFTPTDPTLKRTLHQLGLLFDQPVGIDVVWQVFLLYDLRDGTFQIAPQIEYAITNEIFLYLDGRWGGRAQSGEKFGSLFRKTEVFNGSESRIGLTLVAYF